MMMKESLSFLEINLNIEKLNTHRGGSPSLEWLGLKISIIIDYLE
jgi:hypothetical protein